MNHIKEEYRKFEDLRDKYNKFGTWDSEVKYAFQHYLKKSLKGESIIDYNWHIYTSKNGSEVVEKELTNQFKKLVKAIKENEDLKAFVSLTKNINVEMCDIKL